MKDCEEVPTKKRKSKTKTKVEGLLSDLRPLSTYVTDPSSLLDQLFLAVDADDIQVLLLPTLQGRSIADLKQDCLLQLKKLTEKQILDILQSCVSHQERGQGVVAPAVDVAPTPVDTADLSTDRSSVQTPDTPISGAETPKGLSKSRPDGSSALHLCPDEREMESLDTSATCSMMAPGVPVAANLPAEPTGESSGEPWTETKTEREIMELEFRARAIRSLMRSQGLVVVDDDDDDEFGGDIQRQVQEKPGDNA